MLLGCCENSNDLDMYSDEEEQRMLNAKMAASKYMLKGWEDSKTVKLVKVRKKNGRKK